jgi:hypothetical protein
MVNHYRLWCRAVGSSDPHRPSSEVDRVPQSRGMEGILLPEWLQ